MKLFLSGSPTLSRYTEGILKRGFDLLGVEIVPHVHEATHAIAQFHGSPEAARFDEDLLSQMTELYRLKSVVLLFHRPDEIKLRMPCLSEYLRNAPSSWGFAMLGTFFTSDRFFTETNPLTRMGRRSIRAIPHGFFELPLPTLGRSAPVIVGTHTTWGEMRSLQTVVGLLAKLFQRRGSLSVAGYLGGLPIDALRRGTVAKLLSQFNCTAPVVQHQRGKTFEPGAIILNPGDPPDDLDMTFNVQIYHLGDSVRRGESSGSLHASRGIPVIAEMNGAEQLEGLQVIKVPYSRETGLSSSLQLDIAAEQIVSCISSLEYRAMLTSNSAAAAQWGPRAVAREYAAFLTELEANNENSLVPGTPI